MHVFPEVSFSFDQFCGLNVLESKRLLQEAQHIIEDVSLCSPCVAQRWSSKISFVFKQYSRACMCTYVMSYALLSLFHISTLKSHEEILSQCDVCVRDEVDLQSTPIKNKGNWKFCQIYCHAYV